MNQKKIGAFIAECRKEQNLTQFQLAEKLRITDRAVSKWETGKGMPDSAIMLRLCDALDINVNELLNARHIKEQDYDKNAEKLLLALAERETTANRRLMACEQVIGWMCSIMFIVLIFVSAYLVESLPARIILFVLAFVVLLAGVSVCLMIETNAGYYECQKCHHKYIPRYAAVYGAPHFGTTRYMKCPACGKRSWQKKVMSK